MPQGDYLITEKLQQNVLLNDETRLLAIHKI